MVEKREGVIRKRKNKLEQIIQRMEERSKREKASNVNKYILAARSTLKRLD